MASDARQWHTEGMEPENLAPFDRPAWWWFALLDGPLGLLALLALRPGLAAKVRRRIPLQSDRTLRAVFALAIAIHLGEGALAWKNAKKRGVPALPWVLQTTLVGFPSLLLLNQRPEVENEAE